MIKKEKENTEKKKTREKKWAEKKSTMKERLTCDNRIKDRTSSKIFGTRTGHTRAEKKREGKILENIDGDNINIKWANYKVIKKES